MSVDTKMTAPEVVAEIEWLLAAHEHPAMICTMIGRTPSALEKLCRAQGRKDLAAIFYPEVKYSTRRGTAAA